jgi:hypothetical protein
MGFKEGSRHTAATKSDDTQERHASPLPNRGEVIRDLPTAGESGQVDD